MTLLSATDLGGGYGGPPVVRGVSLTVAEGRCLAVLGPNGAGKSTLLRLLAGILPPQEGTIFLAGRPLAAWRRRAAARWVSMVPQSVAFAFPLSLRELVAQGRAPHLGPWRPFGPADHAAVRRALAAVGLAEKAEVPVQHLSGGERQRAVLARALAAEPRVLLLDEPAAAQDLHHQVALAGILRRLMAGGVGVALVAHDLNLALALAHEVVLLREGRVAGRGAPQEVLTPEVLYRVFGAQVEVLPRPGGGFAVLPRWA